MDKHLEKLGRAVRVEGEISIARGLEGGGGGRRSRSAAFDLFSRKLVT